MDDRSADRAPRTGGPHVVAPGHRSAPPDVPPDPLPDPLPDLLPDLLPAGVPLDLPDDDAAARVACYTALEALQVHDRPDAFTAVLEHWSRQAHADGRPQIRVQVTHCLVVNEMLAGDDPARLRARLDDLEEAAVATGDEIFVARALAARVACGGAGGSGSEDPTGGLARAVAMLDEAYDAGPATLGRRAVELAGSYNECGQAYHRLDLWELEEEMYARAAACVGLPVEDALSPVLGFTRTVLVINRVESAAAAACALLDVGRAEDAARVAAERYRPSEADLDLLPTVWGHEVRACERLLDAIAAGPDGDPGLREVPDEHWQELTESTWSGYQGCLLLAAAVASHLRGEVERAASLASRAADLIDDYKPSFFTLALHLAALGCTDEESLRWGRHLGRLRSGSRLQVLSSARARLAAERVVRHNEQLRRQAFVDELTGVANRHAHSRHLEALRGSGERRLGVVLVDVDEFKSVNDRFGHTVGDEVLRVLGRLLAGAVRSTDLAVRLGGDEFALFVFLDGGAPPVRRAQRLVEDVRTYRWEDVAPGLHVTVSVGTAAGPAREVDALARLADERLYRAKAAGRDRVGA